MMNTVWPNKEEEEATPRLGSIDVGDFSNTIYDFFTGDQTGENFLTNIGLQVSLLYFLQKVIIFLQNSKHFEKLKQLQFAYNVVGYLSSHLVWQVMYNQQIDLYCAFQCLCINLFCHFLHLPKTKDSD